MTRHRCDLNCVAKRNVLSRRVGLSGFERSLRGGLLGAALLVAGAASPALADCQTNGAVRTCTGSLPGGEQYNAGATTLNVNSLTGPVNGQIRLRQDGGDGGSGHDGALFVPPASGGSGGSGGGSAPTVTNQTFNQATGVAVITYSDGSIITLTPKQGTADVYTKQTQTPKSGGGYDTTTVDIPATVTQNSADGSLTISLGTNGNAGTMTIKPGQGGGSLTGGGLNLNYVGTGQTLTTANQPGVIAISRGGDGGSGGDYYLGGGGARGGNGGAGGSATVTSKAISPSPTAMASWPSRSAATAVTAAAPIPSSAAAAKAARAVLRGPRAWWRAKARSPPMATMPAVWPPSARVAKVARAAAPAASSPPAVMPRAPVGAARPR